MNFGCSICAEVFANKDESLYSTPCGHVFHYQCILRWIERAKTCPLCRKALTANKLIKLNLCVEGGSSPRTTLKEDCERSQASFNAMLHNLEYNMLQEKSKTAIQQNKGLKDQVKKLEEEVRTYKSTVCDYRREIEDLRRRLAEQRNIARPMSAYDGGTIELNSDDSDSEILEVVDAIERNARASQLPETYHTEDIAVLDDGRGENSTNENELQDLRNQLKFKQVMLDSALSRISELEKENRTLMENLF